MVPLGVIFATTVTKLLTSRITTVQLSGHHDFRARVRIPPLIFGRSIGQRVLQVSIHPPFVAPKVEKYGGLKALDFWRADDLKVRPAPAGEWTTR